MKEYLMKVTRTIEFYTLVEAENEDEAIKKSKDDFEDYLYHELEYDGIDKYEVKQIRRID